MSDDVIYSAFLRIAVSDGRNILYAVNVDKKSGIRHDKERTSNLDAAVKARIPSENDNTTTSAESQEGAIKKSSRDRDAEYTDLAKDPVKNEAKLRDMVDQAAKDAGYSFHLYHGTNAEFSVFDVRKNGGKNGKGEGYGIYLASNKTISDAYGKRVIDSYVKFNRLAEGAKKTLSLREIKKIIKATCEHDAKISVSDGEYDSISEALKDTWVSNYVYTYEYPSMDKVYSDVANTIFDENGNDGDIINEIMAASGRHYTYTAAMNFYDELLTPITGIDGFHYVWGDENDIYLAFRSNQIKQSDPVTYDGNGDIVPLSERFNEKNDDIRYMTREQADSDSELFSIKEQLEASKEKLNASSPVCDLTVPVSFSGKRKAAAYVTEQMKKWGYKVDRQNFGLIYFNEKDISKAADYADTNEEKAAMLAVPYVLKRGFIIGEQDNHKKRNKRTITFGAKVQLNGTPGNMAVVVNLNGNHYNVSRIVNPDGSAFVFKSKEAGQEPNQGVRSNASLADSTSPTSKSNYISDLDESQYTSEKTRKRFPTVKKISDITPEILENRQWTIM